MKPSGCWRRGSILPLLVCGVCLLAGVSGAAVRVRAVTLDGHSLQGDLQSIEQARVTLHTRSGLEHVEAEGLHLLRFLDQDPQAGDSSGFAELVDGSRLAGSISEVTEAQVVLELSGEAERDGTTAVPLNAVGALVLSRGDAALLRQWSAIRSTPATSDLLVVKRRDGQTLDYVEGIITTVSDKRVTIDLDGEQVDVNRSRVYGVVYFRPDAPPRATDTLEIRTPYDHIQGSRVVWGGGPTVRVHNPLVGELPLPLSQLRSIDFSRGGVAMLGDLTAESVSWRPALGPPPSEELVRQWGLMRQDASYDGGPIELAEGDGARRTFDAGLAIRSEAEVVLRAPKGMNYLRAEVGVSPDSSGATAIQLSVYGDGRQLVSESYRAGQSPRELQTPVSGARRLRIVVQRAPGASVGGILHLADARLTR